MTCFNFLASALGNWFMVSGDSAKRPALRILLEACQGLENLAPWFLHKTLRQTCRSRTWAESGSFASPKNSETAICESGARYIGEQPTFNTMSAASLGALGAWPGLGPPAYVPPVMPQQMHQMPQQMPQQIPQQIQKQVPQAAGRVWKRSFYVFPFWVDHSFGWIVVMKCDVNVTPKAINPVLIRKSYRNPSPPWPCFLRFLGHLSRWWVPHLRPVGPLEAMDIQQQRPWCAMAMFQQLSETYLVGWGWRE